MAAEPLPAQMRRAHWLALVFGLGASLRTLWPLALLYVLGIGSQGTKEIGSNPVLLGSMVLVVGLSALSAILGYAFASYGCTERELVRRTGWLHREERRIPIAQIHEVSSQQGVLQRVLGLATVKIQTASGPGTPEVTLDHISLDAVAELRRMLRGEASEARPAPQAPPAGDVLLELAPLDLVRIGLIENRGFAALLGIYTLLTRFVDDDWWLSVDAGAWVDAWLGDGPRGFLGASAWLEVALELAVGAIAAALALRILSIGWNLYYRHGFTLQRCGAELRTEQGLGERRSDVVPVSSIQMVRVDAGLLHRLTGRVSVRATTSGGTSSIRGGVEQVLAPVLPEAALARFLPQVWERLALDDVAWERLPPRSRRRFATELYVTTTLILAAILLVAGPWGGIAGDLIGRIPVVGQLAQSSPALLGGFSVFWLAGWLPLALLYGAAQQRFTAYSLGAEVLRFRTGWFVRRTWIFPYASLHTLELAESPFDRRHGMRSLVLAGAGTSRVAVPFLGADVANRMYARLRREARRTRGEQHARLEPA
jgi:putative membrane protein